MHTCYVIMMMIPWMRLLFIHKILSQIVVCKNLLMCIHGRSCASKFTQIHSRPCNLYFQVYNELRGSGWRYINWTFIKCSCCTIAIWSMQHLNKTMGTLKFFETKIYRAKKDYIIKMYDKLITKLQKNLWTMALRDNTPMRLTQGFYLATYL